MAKVPSDAAQAATMQAGEVFRRIGYDTNGKPVDSLFLFVAPNITQASFCRP